MKKLLNLILIIVFCFTTQGIAQSEKFEGSLILENGSELNGIFSSEITKKTNYLTFTQDSGKSLDVHLLNDALLHYSGSDKWFKSKNIEGKFEFLEVVVKGDANFYKSLKTQKLYIENTKNKSGFVQLINPGDIDTRRANTGKLLVVFEDCLPVRTRTYDSELSVNRITQLMNDYNNCDQLSEEFEITKQEETDQTYSDQKTLLNFDIGAGYFGLDNDIAIITDESTTSDNATGGGLSFYASLNISPSYFNGYTGNIYMDISLQYNLNNSIEFSDINKDLSSLFLNFTPKYYLGNIKANFRPFVGFGFGIGLLNVEIEDNTGARFDRVNDTVFRFLYSPQIGVLLFNTFEVSADFYPYYSNDIILESSEVKLESTFTSFTIKLGYHF